MAYKMLPISYDEYCILRDAGAWAVACYYELDGTSTLPGEINDGAVEWLALNDGWLHKDFRWADCPASRYYVRVECDD
jgi:hypothetical protein